MADAPHVLCLFHRGFELFPRGYKQIESLDRDGYEVTVLCATRTELPSEDHEGINIRRFQTPWPDLAVLKPLALLWILLNLIIRGVTEEQVDAIHSFGIYSLLPGVIISQILSVKLTYDAFEDYRYQFEQSGAIPFATEFFGKLLVGFERLLVLLSDGVFVVPSADNVLETRFSTVDTPVTTIWNVPRLREGVDKTNKDRRDKKPITVLYVGGISVNKGAREMIEAAVGTLRQVDVPIQFVFIGGHSKKVNRELRSFIPAQYKDDITFPGFVPYEDVMPYLKSADIALQLYQPTFWNRQSKASSKLFRYMAAHLPLVISDFPGFGSIVRDLEVGIPVEPGEPEAAADALTELVTDDKKRGRLGKNGYKKFRQRYNWEAEEDHFLNSFEVATKLRS
jgi:glycosyltransferase involved in cell wall biosynthesis